MFWGLLVEPNKRYQQTVVKSFHVSMASLEINKMDKMDSEMVSVLAEIENQEYILCHLQNHKIMQCQLDLNFKAGEEITFYSSGKSKVHLTGYVIENFDDLSEEEEDDDKETEKVSTSIPAVTGTLSKAGIPAKAATKVKREDTPIAQPGKKRQDEISNTPNAKKAKVEMQEEEEEDEDEEESEEETSEEAEDEEDDDEEESEESDTAPANNLNKTPQVSQNKGPGGQKTPVGQANKQKTPQSVQNSPSQEQSSKKKKNKLKQMNTPSENGTPQGKKKSQADGTPTGSESSTPQKKVLQGGVQVEDIETGKGPAAKAGKQVIVYYVGRLKQNNKQFDATTQGPGFKFALGRNEVIKGWDVGVAGMRVGGKRRITCPPHMAYGKKGQPPTIPPNSVLVFDVELRAIN